MTKKERIIELSKSFDPIEVAEICKVSASYVYRVLREHKATPKLLIDEYFKALQSGITNKADLARHFGVARNTLWRFEKEHINAIALAQYLYITRGNIQEVSQHFKLSRKEEGLIAQSPTLVSVVLDLERILNLLLAIKNKNPVIIDLCENIKKALNILNC